MDATHQRWTWPVNLEGYNRHPALTADEKAAISYVLAHHSSRRAKQRATILQRLLQPLLDVLGFLESPQVEQYAPIRVLLREMDRRGTAYWGWSSEEWAATIASSWDAFWQRHGRSGRKARQQVIVMAYLLGQFKAFDRFERATLQLYQTASLIFGSHFHTSLHRVCTVLTDWGYSHPEARVQLALADVCLANGSPAIEDLSLGVLATRHQLVTSKRMANGLALISRALAELKVIQGALPLRPPSTPAPQRALAEGIAPEWQAWCSAWYRQSVLATATKETYFTYLRKVGAWLWHHHPTITNPEQWTYELALEFASAVTDFKIGDYITLKDTAELIGLGKGLTPRSKDHMFTVLRRFFTDLQEIPHSVGGAPARRIARHFNPQLVFQTPASIRRLIGPDPRVIDDIWWGKILQAATELTEEDLPRGRNGFMRYPLALVRAVAVTWCYSALRSDELRRLRVGCIRWQWDDAMLTPGGGQVPADAVCFLHVPVNKTNTAFWKPVYALVGRYITAWEQQRPPQPCALDKKTNELVDLLFSYRGGGIGTKYLNAVLIPLLCDKAGLPRADARGAITSHRARATIATLYYNCPEGLTGLEIQAFLGHTSFRSTQSYIKASPTKLAKAVARANKNARLVRVVVDTQAAIEGEPAIFYDLGDGTFCGNPAWAACPHRMACIKCPMHVGVELARVIRARAGVMHLLQEVPDLSDDERAAAEGDRVAFDKLIAKYAHVLPPAVPNDRYAFNAAVARTADEQSSLTIPLLQAAGREERR